MKSSWRRSSALRSSIWTIFSTEAPWRNTSSKCGRSLFLRLSSWRNYNSMYHYIILGLFGFLDALQHGLSQEKGCSRLATAHITPCCPTLSWFHKFLYGRNFIKGLNTTTPSQKCSWVPARHILDPELIRGVSSSFCDVFKMEIWEAGETESGMRSIKRAVSV